MNGKYLQTFFCFAISLTQIAGAYVGVGVALPWCIVHIVRSNWADSWNEQRALYTEALVVMGCLYYGHAAVREHLLRMESEHKNILVSTLVVDFALVLGVTKFGLQGMLLGPLMVAIGGVVWDRLLKGRQSMAGTGPGTAADAELEATSSPTSSPKRKKAKLRAAPQPTEPEPQPETQQPSLKRRGVAGARQGSVM